TQQNAALVEESAAAAESLREQAARLSQIVQQFHLGDDVAPHMGTLHAASPAPSARLGGGGRGQTLLAAG
ncbi:MAG: methyl-accepting chemotaxis protein, partial [Comamonadaceae bacterium]